MVKTGIVILHGYNSTPLFMKGIEFEIRRWGKIDQILNLSLYGSKWGIFPNKYNLTTPILRVNEDQVDMKSTLSEHVLNQLKAEIDPNLDQVILLGHSMGGLIWRALYKCYFHDHQNNWVGRNSPNIAGIIQLASPNQGSKLTNMNAIRLYDKLQSSVILKFAGYSINLINKILNKITANFSENHSKFDDINLIHETTQIDQMSPGSDFLNWLNADPTYTDEIPHYRIIGERNGVFFTKLAWIETSDELDEKEIDDNLISKVQKDGLKKTLEDEIDLKDEFRDQEFKSIEDTINTQNQMNDDENASLIYQIMKLFTVDDYTPNDGLVSIEDAKLPGSIILDLGEYKHRISHHSICMWFLPFKPYRKVRDLVFESITKLIENSV